MPQLPGSGSPALSASQLATLAELGEERTADVGDVLFRVGDRTYPFIAILEGEVAILDAAGNEIVRHGRVEVPGRAEPAVRADGLPHRRRHAAPALHRRRPRRAAVAAVRGRAAQRPLAVDVHRPARGAAAGAGRRVGDRRPALVRGDHADARLRAEQSAALHLARRDASRRTDERACPWSGCRAASSSGPVDRRGLPGAGHRPRARAARGGRPARGRRRARPASAPPSTAPRRASTRSSSTAPRSAGRPARRGGSRTTSDSRPASAERS